MYCVTHMNESFDVTYYVWHDILLICTCVQKGRKTRRSCMRSVFQRVAVTHCVMRYIQVYVFFECVTRLIHIAERGGRMKTLSIVRACVSACVFGFTMIHKCKCVSLRIIADGDNRHFPSPPPFACSDLKTLLVLSLLSLTTFSEKIERRSQGRGWWRRHWGASVLKYCAWWSDHHVCTRVEEGGLDEVEIWDHV